MGIFGFWMNLTSAPDSVAFFSSAPSPPLKKNQESFENKQLRVAELRQFLPVSVTSKTSYERSLKFGMKGPSVIM
jgi:hypothetical protein